MWQAIMKVLPQVLSMMAGNIGGGGGAKEGAVKEKEKKSPFVSYGKTASAPTNLMGFPSMQQQGYPDVIRQMLGRA